MSRLRSTSGGCTRKYLVESCGDTVILQVQEKSHRVRGYRS
jgi:hypothetical protein